MANIFISYRREDSGGHTGRMCDRLSARFGSARVFMDLQDVRPGQDFAQSIDEMIATCQCVIAVIGPRWLEAIQRRASGGEDFVQHEIAAALRRGVTVIPVLVGGARMPSGGDLPPAMSALRHRNAFEVRDERFDDDVARLGDAINALGVPDDSSAGSQRRPWYAAGRMRVIAAAGLVAAAAVAVYVMRRPAPPDDVLTPIPPMVSARALDGDWVAEIKKESQPMFRVRLSFAVAGESITGMVRYPSGDAPILDARMAGRVLTFQTTHVPQFESKPATIRYQAEVADDEIRFTTTDEFGIGKGVARRLASEAATLKVNAKDGESYVWIPPGRFVMGCSAGDPACDDDEKPAHTVEIRRGFWLARTEVGEQRFRVRAPAVNAGDGRPGELPATGVSWAAAKSYCQAVGGRLPTEAEWEYAARAGSSTRYYGTLAAIAWFADNSDDRPHPVGAKQPNAHGLHDMLGNVSEWVLDRYYNKYDETSDEDKVEEPLAGNASGVARGGSWVSGEDGVRVSRRLEMPPDAEEPHIGFRCAADQL
jgi:formylglycine-generating enzyme required for sulfatase activity